ncbi:hypothetical protein CCAX7_004550 [Capsulimonas corticalis]|uniref:Circadian input-output histidine kinase CikA n=1 Tax=Capsulimonas corticalis TaxID=2219043 RepID=A0A402D2T7_9BACT|nr:ATP-binding protein [Capsulimonas corticalis]BDI28404.1 hypothetical protein CCAX7_004550 [Capsulimonas corticalis]
MLKLLLRPAAVVMNRLRYPVKFALIGLLFLLPLLVVMFYFLTEINARINFVNLEMEGVALDTPVVQLYGDILQRQQLVDLRRLGIQKDTASLSQLDGKIDSDIANIDAVARVFPNVSILGANWGKIKNDWNLLKSGYGMEWPEKSLERHSTLLNEIAIMIGDFSTDSNLILDPNADSYYMIDTAVDCIPHVLVNLGRARLAGVEVASRKTATLGDLRQLIAGDAQISTQFANIRTNLNHVYAADPTLKQSLEGGTQSLLTSGDRFQELISSGVLASGKPTVSPSNVILAGNDLQEAALEYHGAVISTLTPLLNHRLRLYTHRKELVVWLAAVSLTFAVYLLSGFYVGAVEGIDRLLDTVQRIAHGDFDKTATFHRPDEIGRLAADLEDLVQNRTTELTDARNVAEGANKAKSVFLANMSHELRTPLNAVLGFSNLLVHDANISEDNRKTLHIINRSGEHLLGLINDVLDVARIEAGRIVMESTPFDMGAMLRDLTDMMRLRAEEKGLLLIYDQSSLFPRFVRSDAAKLRQILINLINNAIKYTQHGAVTVRLDAAPADVPDRVKLTFEIADTGIGIARGDRDRIFEPFVQLGESTETKGTGLGLTITKQYVELMGGRMGVDSEVGKGSRFHVTVMVGLAEESEILRADIDRGRVVGLVPDQREYRVLIVEDQIENSLLLERLLADVGFRVRVAENGMAGVEMFRLWNPHFIWMDRRMPVMDGIEATLRIRAMEGGEHVKIAGLSASAFTDQRQEALTAGMDDFVSKPYRPEEIYDCLARQLNVMYTYQDTPPAVLSLACPTAQELSALPPLLRKDLMDALLQLDIAYVAEAISRISQQDAAIGRALAFHAETLSYTPILQSLQQCEQGAIQGRSHE